MPRKIAAICVLSLLFLGGCAAGPNRMLLEAESAVAQVSNDEQVVQLAPITVAEAQDILGRAQQAAQEDEITHRAELSLLKVKTARAKARQINAQTRAETTSKKADDLQLTARAEQAQNALRDAELARRRAAEAQREAAEAQRRAKELRNEAAQERQQAQAERTRAQTTQNRLAEVQQSLAELKPRLTDRGLVLTLGEVLFDFDSANLKPYTQRIMDRLAVFLQDYPNHTLQVEGHTDRVGTATYNLQLSRARAQSVTDALLTRGIAAGRINTEGFGESRPIASNETDAGRRENRRVEVVISQGG